MGKSIKKRILLGAHMSIAGGVFNAIIRGEELGCTAIQIFTKNQNQWSAKPLLDEEITRYKEERKRTGIFVIAHSAYLPNLATPDDVLWKRSVSAMHDEMSRCDALEIPSLIFHPGSYTTGERKTGIAKVAKGIDELYSSGDFDVALTLETTAGQGTNLGSSFEELAEIISLSKYSERLRVCFDTCHSFAGGYDIRTAETYANTLEQFDKIIGKKRLSAVHLNDSKGDLGSRKDRHEHIGEGHIGLDGFKNIMNDKRFSDIPLILETPKERETSSGRILEMDKVNLKTLKDLII